MPTSSGRCLLLPSAAACLALLAGCASRPLPRFEQPLPRTASQHVRTTAYTHSESDHQQYGHQSAAGTYLQYGQIHSAAADWSRWPNGTLFRIRETGEVCQVDDYGWALSGTNTIDLYKPSRGDMNAWGVKHVTIDILQWGDPWKSYAILQPRGSYAHVRRMLVQIKDRYDRNKPAAEPTGSGGPMVASVGPAPTPVAPPVTYAAAPVPPERVARAMPVSVTATRPSSSTGRSANLTPFYQ